MSTFVRVCNRVGRLLIQDSLPGFDEKLHQYIEGKRQWTGTFCLDCGSFAPSACNAEHFVT